MMIMLDSILQMIFVCFLPLYYDEQWKCSIMSEVWSWLFSLPLLSCRERYFILSASFERPFTFHHVKELLPIILLILPPKIKILTSALLAFHHSPFTTFHPADRKQDDDSYRPKQNPSSRSSSAASIRKCYR